MPHATDFLIIVNWGWDLNRSDSQNITDLYRHGIFKFVVEETFVDPAFTCWSLNRQKTDSKMSMPFYLPKVHWEYAKSQETYVFTEALAIISACKEEVSVEMKVIRRQLSHTHDGLLAVFFDCITPWLFLYLAHQPFLQTCNHLSLRVYILKNKKERKKKDGKV